MTKISDIGGVFVHHAYAAIPLEDRGYQFADGVYEVAAYFNQQCVDGDLHWDRLERSLNKLDIAMPMTRGALQARIDRLIRTNRRRDGIVYLQCTRGVQRPRNHVYPKDLKPHLTIQILPARPPSQTLKETGVSAHLVDDMRWNRCDIKTICLLPNIMARAEATAAGAREGWQVNKEGFVTEGTLSNASIVTKENVLRTHPLSHAILGGVTRDITLQIAQEQGIQVEEKAFTPEEAMDAKEAFMTSATSNVLPITSLNGKPIGSGKPGDITRTLLNAYEERIFTQTGKRL